MRIRRSTPPAVRFWKHVNKTDGCWLWTGSVSRNGYGRFSPGHGSLFSAHRLSFTMEHGPIPDGLFVCHRCDVRNCVNPAHLFLGTARDNVHDMIQKGRAAFSSAAGRTHCIHGHELTDANVRMEGNERICRRCVADRVALHRERRRQGVKVVMAEAA